MIPVLLLDTLADFLREVNRDYRREDAAVNGNPLFVEPWYFKRSETAAETFYPYIAPRLIKGDDTANGSTVSVRLYFGTYSENAAEGWRELYNLMEHSRQALLKKRVLANRFRLKLPIHWEVPEDQAHPEWAGVLDLIYEIAQPQEEIL